MEVVLARLNTGCLGRRAPDFVVPFWLPPVTTISFGDEERT